MINPNKWIKKRLIELVPDVKVWANMVPKSVKPTPVKYGLITSMSKNEIAVSKTCYEWSVGFNLDLYKINDLGFDGSTELDDLAEIIIPRIKDMKLTNFRVKNVYLESENELIQDTSTNTINRKILTYTIWVSYEG